MSKERIQETTFIGDASPQEAMSPDEVLKANAEYFASIAKIFGTEGANLVARYYRKWLEDPAPENHRPGPTLGEIEVRRLGHRP